MVAELWDGLKDPCLRYWRILVLSSPLAWVDFTGWFLRNNKWWKWWQMTRILGHKKAVSSISLSHPFPLPVFVHSRWEKPRWEQLYGEAPELRNGSLQSITQWVRLEGSPLGPVRSSERLHSPGYSLTATSWDTPNQNISARPSWIPDTQELCDIIDALLNFWSNGLCNNR